MSYQRSQSPTTGPLQTPAAPQSAPELSPLLGLQGLIGNAGVLDLLRPQLPGAQTEASPSPLGGALQTVLQQGATAPPLPPGGTEAPSTALAAELGTTQSQAQAQAPRASSWWDDAVDTTVSGVGGLVDGGVDALSDVPLLGAAAATMAPVTKFAWETLGGFAKGGGDLVGGLVHMGLHPIDTMMGIGTMLEHIPFSPLKTLHHVYDIAAGNKSFDEVYWKNPLDYASDELSDDGAYWGQVLGGIAAPYKESMAEGKHGEALGRGIFDVGSLLMGVGEARALGEGAEVVNVLDHAPIANKVDDAVKLASKGKALGAAEEELAQVGGKAEDVTKTAGQADQVADLGKADDATKLGNQPVTTVAPQPTQAAPVAATTTPAPPAAPSSTVDLLSPDRRIHILDGDGTGGGHRAGTGKPEKSEFPASWSDDQIIHHVSDVATDPRAVPDPNNSPLLYNRRGRPIRHTYTSVRDGVEIQVVVEPATGEIISGYPTGLADPTTGQILPYPRNPAATP